MIVSVDQTDPSLFEILVAEKHEPGTTVRDAQGRLYICAVSDHTGDHFWVRIWQPGFGASILDDKYCTQEAHADEVIGVPCDLRIEVVS